MSKQIVLKILKENLLEINEKIKVLNSPASSNSNSYVEKRTKELNEEKQENETAIKFMESV